LASLIWINLGKKKKKICIKRHGQYQHDLLDRISGLLEHIAKKNKKNNASWIVKLSEEFM
jgi:hypothetical protein